jgi:hypothetical protein
MKPQPIFLALSLIALAGCRPTPPPTEQPPEPTAATTAADAAAKPAADSGATQMRDAIQAPLDKARAVQETTQKAADEQRAAIDAATAQ